MIPPRHALAFIVAPVVPAFLWGAYLTAVALLEDEASQPVFPQVWGVVTFVAWFAYLHAILLGVPIAFLFAKRDWMTLPRVLCASALIGALPLTTWFAYFELADTTSTSNINGIVHTIDGRLTLDGWIGAIVNAVQLAASGIVAGAVWWAIARPSKRLSNASAV